MHVTIQFVNLFVALTVHNSSSHRPQQLGGCDHSMEEQLPISWAERWKQSHVFSAFVFFPLHVSRYTKQEAGPKQTIWLVHGVSPACGSQENCCLKGPVTISLFYPDNMTVWVQAENILDRSVYILQLKFLRHEQPDCKWLLWQKRVSANSGAMYLLLRKIRIYGAFRDLSSYSTTIQLNILVFGECKAPGNPM